MIIVEIEQFGSCRLEASGGCTVEASDGDVVFCNFETVGENEVIFTREEYEVDFEEELYEITEL